MVALAALPAIQASTAARPVARAALPAKLGSTNHGILSLAVRHLGSQQQAARSRGRWRRERRAAAPPCRAQWGQPSSLGRQRTTEVVGVVIVDAGRRTPEGDELLLDFAAAYGQAHRRGIVAVANPATLETAVRDCVIEGADKVMVVPYLLSRRREVEGDLPTALADVQLKLPGVRCIIGEAISVESILAQHIENQVKAVESKPVAQAEERWWTPEPALDERASARGPASLESSRAAALPPPVQQRVWGEAVSHLGAGGQPWDVEMVDEAEEEALLEPVRIPAAAPAAAPAPATTVAWSDDFSAALTGGVLVVDYRQQSGDTTSSSRLGSAATSYNSAGAGSGGGFNWGGGGGMDDWGSNGMDSGRAPAASPSSSSPAGPAYWYTSNSDSGGSSSFYGGSDSSSGGGGSSSFNQAGSSSFSSSSFSSPAASSPSYSSTFGGAGGPSYWADPEAEPQPEAAAAAAAAGSQPEEVGLEHRLAHMEEQLQTITELLVRGQGRRQAVSAEVVAGSGSEGADPSLYSEQQLEFLRRKEQQWRQ